MTFGAWYVRRLLSNIHWRIWSGALLRNLVNEAKDLGLMLHETLNATNIGQIQDSLALNCTNLHLYTIICTHLIIYLRWYVTLGGLDGLEACAEQTWRASLDGDSAKRIKAVMLFEFIPWRRKTDCLSSVKEKQLTKVVAPEHMIIWAVQIATHLAKSYLEHIGCLQYVSGQCFRVMHSASLATDKFHVEYVEYVDMLHKTCVDHLLDWGSITIRASSSVGRLEGHGGTHELMPTSNVGPIWLPLLTQSLRIVPDRVLKVDYLDPPWLHFFCRCFWALQFLPLIWKSAAKFEGFDPYGFDTHTQSIICCPAATNLSRSYI